MTSYYAMYAAGGELLSPSDQGGEPRSAEEDIALSRFFDDAVKPTTEQLLIRVDGFLDPGEMAQNFASTVIPGVIAADPTAWEILRPFVVNDCQAIPLEHSERRKYFALRVYRLDALDYSRAKVVYWVNKPIMPVYVQRIETFAFKENALRGVNLFGLPESRGDYPIVSEQLKEVIEQAGLTGARFRPLPMAE